MVMNTSIFIWLIYALWLTLVAYLIVAAIDVKREPQGHLGQSLGLMFSMIAAFLLPHLPIFQFVNFASVNPVVSGIGLILCVAGMAFLVWARQRLGKNWGQTFSVKFGHEPATSGPYSYVRHPMYTGGLIACIGSAIVAGG